MNKYCLLFICKVFCEKVYMGFMVCYVIIVVLFYVGCLYGVVKLIMYVYYKGVFLMFVDGIMLLLSYFMFLLMFGVFVLFGYIVLCKVSLILFGVEFDYYCDCM